MSGGHFDYKQYGNMDIADRIDSIVDNNGSFDVDEFGDSNGWNLEQETIAKLEETSKLLRRVTAMVTRIDYLVCFDDSEESFLRRWKEEGLGE